MRLRTRLAGFIGILLVGVLSKPTFSEAEFSVEKAEDGPALFFVLQSDTLPITSLSELAIHTLKPQLETIPGVSEIRVVGAKRLLVRMRISGVSLSKRNLDIKRIDDLLTKLDLHFTPVQNDPWLREQIIDTGKPKIDVDTLSQLVVTTSADGSTIRLQDLVQFEIGAQQGLRDLEYLGKPAVALAVHRKDKDYPIGFAIALSGIVPKLNVLLPVGTKIEMVKATELSIKASTGLAPLIHSPSSDRLALNQN